MRIAMAQLAPVVGDFTGNVEKIKTAYLKAVDAQARLMVTPELSLCGYPPHDLVERTEFVEQSEAALKELALFTKGHATALAVGAVIPSPFNTGRAIQNAVLVFEQGREVFRQAKTLLPTYDIFDEARYFEAARDVKVWTCDGKKIAFGICEDLWAEESSFFTKGEGVAKPLYARDPVDTFASEHAEIVISLSASPYEWGKRSKREWLHAELARRLKTPLVYVNQSCGNDEILFDGASFVVDAQGGILHRLAIFEPDFQCFDISTEAQTTSSDSISKEGASTMVLSVQAELDTLTRGLITGIRDYFQRTGFSKAIVGLSGGIDSAVIATLAVRALGRENVMGVAMPSQYSSGHSLEDAEILAKNQGIPFEVRPIKFMFAAMHRELSERRGELAPVAQENLQSRLRGVMLMALSNHYGALVLTTGNKSEIAMGYCTMYGDMCGALAPIGDVFKTRVYELARYLNESAVKLGLIPPIPERSLTKPPSAELRPDQKDQDTLPPYDRLDPVLCDYIERSMSLSALESKYPKDAPWIQDILARLELNEYKRRQSAPVLRVSSKAFGVGRRMPIARRSH